MILMRIVPVNSRQPAIKAMVIPEIAHRQSCSAATIAHDARCDHRLPNVRRTPVTIDINGDSGGPLGNLVCAVLATLNNVVGLVKLLNSILRLVTGLLGGLTGGLGGAVSM
jgi:hypothetical protein